MDSCIYTDFLLLEHDILFPGTQLPVVYGHLLLLLNKAPFNHRDVLHKEPVVITLNTVIA